MKTFNFLYTAAAALLLAACSNENEGIDNNSPVAAKVVADVSGKANAPTTAESNDWTDGDAIGIFVTSAGNTTGSNVKYVYAAGKFDSNTPIYFKDNKEQTFSAYYPYVDDDKINEDGWLTNDWTIDYSNPSNSLTANDFLFASGATASKASPEIKFTDDGSNDNRFKHRMSMVEFTVVPGEGIESSKNELQNIILESIKTKGKINVRTGLTEATGNLVKQKIPVEGTLNKDRTCKFILFPQQFTSNKLTVSCEILYNQTTLNCYTTTINLPNGFEAGKKYTYTIKVNNTSIVIENADITSWGVGADNEPLDAEFAE